MESKIKYIKNNTQIQKEFVKQISTISKEGFSFYNIFWHAITFRVLLKELDIAFHNHFERVSHNILKEVSKNEFK